jgi:hypothetical protein
MYPEITSKLRKMDSMLDDPSFIHSDRRTCELITLMKDGLEFLAKKVHELEQPKPGRQGFTDPHRYLPGSDD